MAKKSLHVVPNPDGNWSIKSSGSSRATEVYKNKGDAISRARRMSEAKSSDLYVHNKSGRIADKYSPSVRSDPFPPRSDTPSYKKKK